MMHFLNDAEVVHHTSDRTRIRIPQRRGDAPWFAEVCARLNRLEGVTIATANRHGATIVIRHGASFKLESIAESLRAAALAAPAPVRDLAETPYVRGQADCTHGRAGEIAAMIVQVAVAVLFGTALTHVLELVARNLFRTAARELGFRLERGWAAA